MSDTQIEAPKAPVPQLPAVVSYRETIVRAASDPAFNVEKLERLIALETEQGTRAAELAFNVALACTQMDIKTVSNDASNPSTRSKYASYAQLDREVRPAYTKHGFSVSFTTESGDNPDMLLVVAMLSNGPITRRYELPIPIDTKGPRGTDHMTRTHATMSAMTYGKRGLLAAMFNIATDDVPDAEKKRWRGGDDDGNAAGGKLRPKHAESTSEPETEVAAPPVPEANLSVYVDEKTGERVEKVTPFELDILEGDTARSWGGKLLACMKAYSNGVADVDSFIGLNAGRLEHIKQNAPVTYSVISGNIEALRQHFLAAEKEAAT